MLHKNWKSLTNNHHLVKKSICCDFQVIYGAENFKSTSINTKNNLYIHLDCI